MRPKHFLFSYFTRDIGCLEKILESLKENKITVYQAKKLLSLYSIEEIEGFAKIVNENIETRAIFA